MSRYVFLKCIIKLISKNKNHVGKKTLISLNIGIEKVMIKFLKIYLELGSQFYLIRAVGLFILRTTITCQVKCLFLP